MISVGGSVRTSMKALKVSIGAIVKIQFFAPFCIMGEMSMSLNPFTRNTIYTKTFETVYTSSLLSHCWFGDSKSIWPIKIEWWCCSLLAWLSVLWSAYALHMVQIPTPSSVASEWFLPRDALQCKARYCYYHMSSVHLFVCDVGGSWPYRLKNLETNCTNI